MSFVLASVYLTQAWSRTTVEDVTRSDECLLADMGDREVLQSRATGGMSVYAIFTSDGIIGPNSIPLPTPEHALLAWTT